VGQEEKLSHHNHDQVFQAVSSNSFSDIQLLLTTDVSRVS